MAKKQKTAAGKTVTIKVTQADIDRGRPGSESSCPIARALKRKFPRKRAVYVTTKTATLCNAVSLLADLPPVAKLFIRRFDGERDVAPISFTVTFLESL